MRFSIRRFEFTRPSKGARFVTRHLTAILAAGVLCLLTVAALAAPLIAGRDPNEQDIAARLLPPWQSRTHLLGTDHLGRDMWSRLVYGSRVSLQVGFVTASVAGVLGSTIGLLAGYYGGIVERLVLWISDVQLAIPFLLLMIAIVAAIGPSLQTLIIALSLTNWMVFARIARAQTLVLRSREYVDAARVIGAGDGRILWRHLAINVMPALVVVVTFEVARMIITESSLSFLGLGVPARVPSWGGMLADARTYLTFAPWLVTLPGLGIAITVLAVNVLGDWLRDLVDPRLRH
jgi:peptide/nickel transport system permease protein